MVAVPHERIVNLLATSVGEVRVTSMNMEWKLIHLSPVDHNENDADIDVSPFDWTRSSTIYVK